MKNCGVQANTGKQDLPSQFPLSFSTSNRTASSFFKCSSSKLGHWDVLGALFSRLKDWEVSASSPSLGHSVLCWPEGLPRRELEVGHQQHHGGLESLQVLPGHAPLPVWQLGLRPMFAGITT